MDYIPEQHKQQTIMSFETMCLQEKPVASFAEMAGFVKENQGGSYMVPSLVLGDGRKVIAAPSYEFGSFFETALIVADTDGKTYQVESITAGWIKTSEELADYFEKGVAIPYYCKSECNLIFGQPKGTETAYFTCGCCGSKFHGNVAKQLKFDQDSGYGICPRCEHYYS